MITLYPLPQVDSSDGAAKWLKNETTRLNADVRSDFNGTPMVVFRSDSWEMALMRWHYERLLIQIANGVVNVRDYADMEYVRR